MRLDALVNNAAVALPSGNLSTQMTTCFRTNAIGPALTVELFTPLLKNSKTTARIVNVTSGAGSITRRLDPSAGFNKLREVQYRASKSALNMVTACQAVDLGPDGVKVFAYCPGFTVSNLGGFNTAENGAKPTSEGAKPIVDILNGKRDAEHGGFLHEKGQYAW